MCRVVQYYLNVYKRFHVLPILFIVYASKTEPKAERPFRIYPEQALPLRNTLLSLCNWLLHTDRTEYQYFSLIAFIDA
ncbi:hypothetical protein J3Q64DRAFT_1779071 [Phycomyces blakesleeanus]|uniref:Secreted protein n=1 Tax=Phycomyces blakesleeanus TaxID=4837 RepID=A0ABR3AID5_PHYBL